MTEILVTFAELANAQQSVARAARDLNAQLDELKRSLAPLVATWSGQAAVDYQAKQRQWDTAAADLNQVLGQISAALGQANEGYQQVEKLNASRWA